MKMSFDSRDISAEFFNFQFGRNSMVLKKIDAKVARHVWLMDKNLCANLIRNEYIVTTTTKAKRSQKKIESFLSKTFHENKQLLNQEDKLNNRHLKFLQEPDREEIGGKVINELAKRYENRKTGFTRIIKLEPRLGDNSPMTLMELVDSNFDFKFWYTAKIIARLQLQNLPVDDLTSHNVKKVIESRPNGQVEFDNAVETVKKEFFKVDEEGDVTDETIKENLKNLPPNLEYYGGNLVGKTLISKKYNVKPRQPTEGEIPPSPFLAKE